MCNERNRQVWENANIDKQPRGHLQLGANGNDANADRQTEKRGGAVDTWIRLTERGQDKHIKQAPGSSSHFSVTKKTCDHHIYKTYKSLGLDLLTK